MSAAFVVLIALEQCRSLDAQSPAEQLIPGTVVAKQVAGEATHNYRVSVPGGHILRLEAEQAGADVSISILDAQGKKLQEDDSGNDEWGPELVIFRAPESAEYRAVISVLSASGAKPNYRLGVAELRPITH